MYLNLNPGFPHFQKLSGRNYDYQYQEPVQGYNCIFTTQVTVKSEIE